MIPLSRVPGDPPGSTPILQGDSPTREWYFILSLDPSVTVNYKSIDGSYERQPRLADAKSRSAAEKGNSRAE
jgi:TfoX/Sxy family transcriptional regulator of competence genes